MLGVHTRRYVDVELDNLKKLGLQFVPEKKNIKGDNCVIIFSDQNNTWRIHQKVR